MTIVLHTVKKRSCDRDRIPCHQTRNGNKRPRFPKPVFIGDTIHSRITITAKEDDPKRKDFGRVTEKVEVLNQRGECVLACEHVLMVKRTKDR